MANNTGGSSCCTTTKCFETCPCLENLVATPPHRFMYCCPCPPMSLDFYTQSAWAPCLVIWLAVAFMIYGLIPLVFTSFLFGMKLQTCREMVLVDAPPSACTYDAAGNPLTITQNPYTGDWSNYNAAEIVQLPLSAWAISMYHSPFWLIPAVAVQTLTAVNFMSANKFCKAVSAGQCLYANMSVVPMPAGSLTPFGGHACEYYAADVCYSNLQTEQVLKIVEIINLQYSQSYSMFVWGRVFMGFSALVYFLYFRFNCTFLPSVTSHFLDVIKLIYETAQTEFRLSARLWVGHGILIFFIIIFGHLVFEVVSYFLKLALSMLLGSLHLPPWVPSLVIAIADIQGAFLIYYMIRSAVTLHFQFKKDVEYVYQFVRDRPIVAMDKVQPLVAGGTPTPAVDIIVTGPNEGAETSKTDDEQLDIERVVREDSRKDPLAEILPGDSVFAPSSSSPWKIETPTNPYIVKLGRFVNILFPFKAEPNATILEDIDKVSMLLSYQWPITYPLSMMVGVGLVTFILLLVEIPVIAILVIYFVPTIPAKIKQYVDPIMLKALTVAGTVLVSLFVSLFMKCLHCCFFRNETTLASLRKETTDFLWLLTLVDTWVVVFFAPFIGILVIAKAKLTMLAMLFFKSFFRVYQPNMPVPDQLSDSVYVGYVSVVACGVLARLKERRNKQNLGSSLFQAAELKGEGALPLIDSD